MKKSMMSVAALLALLAAPVVSIVYADTVTPAANCKKCSGCKEGKRCAQCKGCKDNKKCKGCDGCSGS